MLKKLQPDVEFVAEQATPLGRVDAGAVVQALGAADARTLKRILGRLIEQHARPRLDPR